MIAYLSDAVIVGFFEALLGRRQQVRTLNQLSVTGLQEGGRLRLEMYLAVWSVVEFAL